ncbi:MAG: C40 family peptidase [Hyphomicrobium sp.]|jgi:cell wall-associated NlpC family hydrolase|nr:C40 family peptidase [Hyphomicrobium sp.]
MTGERLDTRRNAIRPDLADERLIGRYEATRYIAGQPAQVVRPAVPLRRRPVAADGLDTEALYGERLRVFDEQEGWAWVQLERDGYVGYMPANALSETIVTPTHRVKAIGTFLYPEADMKCAPILHLSLNAELTIVEEGERFSRTHIGAWVFNRHISRLDKAARDYVDVAERFIDTPYLWGGKTRIGLDCSGLVQVSLQAGGIEAPRDSDMQFAELGTPVEITGDFEGLERGDLVFWKGHVGIMTDGIMLLHANAHHMATVAETLPEAADRIARTGTALLAVKRLRTSSA